MGDFNVHYEEQNDIIFIKDDREKEIIINNLEKKLNLVNTNN